MREVENRGYTKKDPPALKLRWMKENRDNIDSPLRKLWCRE